MNGVSVDEKTIADIFAGEEKYVVPLYQREYAWTDYEVGRLLADICSPGASFSASGSFPAHFYWYLIFIAFLFLPIVQMSSH